MTGPGPTPLVVAEAREAAAQARAGSRDDGDEAGNNNEVTVFIKDPNGVVTKHVIRKTTKMGEIFKAYTDRKGIPESALRFLFDGEQIANDSTAETLGLEDGGEIVAIDDEGRYPITIRVFANWNTDITQFTIKKSTKMGKVFKAFADLKGVSQSSLRFVLDGEGRIADDSTAEALGLSHGDRIEVMFRTDRTDSIDDFSERLAKKDKLRKEMVELDRSNAVRAFGGPMYDEATARRKLLQEGFDPDDLKREQQEVDRFRNDVVFDYSSCHSGLPPMIHFCRTGDLMMCRYLYSKGVPTTEATSSGYWFPMLAAVNCGPGHLLLSWSGLHVCKWLYDHGAKDDIRRPNINGETPLLWAVRHGSLQTGKWLILHGALSGVGSDVAAIDRNRIRIDFRSDGKYIEHDENDPRPAYFSWADALLSNHDKFITFLGGTLDPPPFAEASLRSLVANKLINDAAAATIVDDMGLGKQRQLWNDLHYCPLRMLAERADILSRIADFVGVVRGRELKIIRGFDRELRDFIKDRP